MEHRRNNIRIFCLMICTIISSTLSAVTIHRIGDMITNKDGSQGIVLWINPDMTGGWMIAMNDLTTSISYGDGNTANTNADDYAGYANTKSLRQQQGNVITTAAGIVDFNNGWYLPAIGQLLIMNNANNIIKGAGGTPLTYGSTYWSSTSYEDKYAVSIERTSQMCCAAILKTAFASVRPIKDFSNIEYDTALSYLWSTGDTVPSIHVSPTQTSSYTVTATTKSGCAVSAEKTIVVKSATATQDIYDTICAGETYTHYGFNKTESGTYDTTFVSDDNVCDIPLTLHLTVMPKYNNTISDIGCANAVYSKYGFDFTPDSAWTYLKTLSFQSQHGCDSTVTLKLTVNPSYSVTKKDTVMQGETYVKNGFNLSARTIAGTETHTLTLSTSKTNCDSIVTLTLIILPKIITSTHKTISDTVCQNSNYTEHGFDLSSQTAIGNYQFTRFVTPYDTLTLNLNVLEKKSTNLNVNICHGTSYQFGKKTRTESGIYVDSLQSVENCDSIVTLILTIRDAEEKEIADTICEGETYTFNGKGLTKTGNYTRHYVNEYGCESTETLSLIVNKKKETDIEETIAAHGTFTFNERSLTQSGEYADTLKTTEGCDSIVRLKLTVEADPMDSLVIPNGFSPNGDGVNDTFTIGGIEGFPKSELIILNRWGNKLFDSKPVRPWDGKNHEGGSVGKDLPVGTYFYLLKLGDGRIVKKGYVYLSK